jgi:uncharacterized membrane protein YbhN (UPF0104 family)
MSGGPEVAGSRSRPAAIKRLWTYFKILVALILIGFVVSKTDVPQMAALLAELSLPWLAASFVLFCMLTLIKTLQYYLLTGRQVPYARVLYVVIMQNAISNFIAGAAGIASYLSMLSIDEGVHLPRAFTSFLVVKVNDMIAVWLVMFTTAVILWPRIGVLQPVVVVVLLFLFVAVALVLAAVLLRQRFVRIAGGLLHRLRLDRLPIALRSMEMAESLASADMGVMLRLFRNSLLLSCLYMAVTLSWFYSNIRTYSLVFPVVVVFFVNAFVQLISWVPIRVFGGLGISETSLVYLFGVFGLPAGQMAAMGIGLRLILYGFTLLVLSYLPLSALFGVAGPRLSREARNETQPPAYHHE